MSLLVYCSSLADHRKEEKNYRRERGKIWEEGERKTKGDAKSYRGGVEDQLRWGGEVDERDEDGGGHQEGADEDGGRLRRDEKAD